MKITKEILSTIVQIVSEGEQGYMDNVYNEAPGFPSIPDFEKANNILASIISALSEEVDEKGEEA